MKRAQITVFMSLLLPLFLAVLGAVLDSAYQQAIRSRIQRSLTLCEYSLLSEYQTDLWERYGLFYLDTAYGEREESEKKVQSRLLTYLKGNLSWKDGEARGAFTPFQTAVCQLEAGDFSRATDGRGQVFYEQAVAFEQDLWGAALLSEWLDCSENARNLEEQESSFQEADQRERNNLEVLRQRRQEEEEEDTQDPTAELVQDRESRLLTMVVAEPSEMSAKAVSLEKVPSVRPLLEGCGPVGHISPGLINDQWFHTYLLERCANAREALQQEQAGEWLAYELEYILIGKESDRENLEGVVNRLLLIREGVNYAYLMTDSTKQAEAFALAAVIAGITLMPELVEALKQVILLTWAYGESVLDVRGLLQGNQIALIKTGESWKLPLTKLFTLRSHLTEYDGRSDTGEMKYEGYLRLLLTMTGRDKKCMRALDIIEGTLRATEQGRYLYMDQCIDGLTVKAEFSAASLFSGWAGTGGAHEMTAERRFLYEW